ncbi:MAG: hypothetical protein ACOYUZ_02725 [Patescibacteria group bacterium]
MRKIAYIIGYAIAFAVIFYASSAFAATPQEIVNQTLANYNSDSGLQMSGNMHIEVKETIWDNTYYRGPKNALFDLEFSQRSLPKDEDGYQDGEGYFKFKKLSIESDTDEFYIDQPITIFWRIAAPNMYIKLDRLPQTISDQLAEMDVDLSAVTQRWFSFEAPEESGMDDLLPPLSSSGADPTKELLNMFNELGDKNFLQVKSTEKRWKNNEGEDIVRVRLGINRSVLYNEYRAELTEAYKIKDYADRQEAIKAAREDYNKNLADAKALHMAANVNITKQKMERLEFGLTQSDDKEDCEWNDDYTDQTCRVIGKSTVVFRAGIWLNETDMSPVNVPYGAMDMDEAEEFFEKAFGL